jgi:ABC-type multidrug transport system ATPase subunit
MTSGSITPAITARRVRKSFGDHRVLDAVDLTVTEGTIFALLGPNGAGKTTICRSIPQPRNITRSSPAAANGPGSQSPALTR